MEILSDSDEEPTQVPGRTTAQEEETMKLLSDDETDERKPEGVRSCSVEAKRDKIGAGVDQAPAKTNTETVETMELLSDDDDDADQKPQGYGATSAQSVAMDVDLGQASTARVNPDASTAIPKTSATNAPAPKPKAKAFAAFGRRGAKRPVVVESTAGVSSQAVNDAAAILADRTNVDESELKTPSGRCTTGTRATAPTDVDKSARADLRQIIASDPNAAVQTIKAKSDESTGALTSTMEFSGEKLCSGKQKQGKRMSRSLLVTSSGDKGRTKVAPKSGKRNSQVSLNSAAPASTSDRSTPLGVSANPSSEVPLPKGGEPHDPALLEELRSAKLKINEQSETMAAEVAASNAKLHLLESELQIAASRFSDQEASFRSKEKELERQSQTDASSWKEFEARAESGFKALQVEQAAYHTAAQDICKLRKQSEDATVERSMWDAACSSEHVELAAEIEALKVERFQQAQLLNDSGLRQKTLLGELAAETGNVSTQSELISSLEVKFESEVSAFLAEQERQATLRASSDQRVQDLQSELQKQLAISAKDATEIRSGKQDKDWMQAKLDEKSSAIASEAASMRTYESTLRSSEIEVESERKRFAEELKQNEVALKMESESTRGVQRKLQETLEEMNVQKMDRVERTELETSEVESERKRFAEELKQNEVAMKMESESSRCVKRKLQETLEEMNAQKMDRVERTDLETSEVESERKRFAEELKQNEIALKTESESTRIVQRKLQETLEEMNAQKMDRVERTELETSEVEVWRCRFRDELMKKEERISSEVSAGKIVRKFEEQMSEELNALKKTAMSEQSQLKHAEEQTRRISEINNLLQSESKTIQLAEKAEASVAEEMKNKTEQLSQKLIAESEVHAIQQTKAAKSLKQMRSLAEIYEQSATSWKLKAESEHDAVNRVHLTLAQTESLLADATARHQDEANVVVDIRLKLALEVKSSQQFVQNEEAALAELKSKQKTTSQDLASEAEQCAAERNLLNEENSRFRVLASKAEQGQRETLLLKAAKDLMQEDRDTCESQIARNQREYDENMAQVRNESGQHAQNAVSNLDLAKSETAAAQRANGVRFELEAKLAELTETSEESKSFVAELKAKFSEKVQVCLSLQESEEQAIRTLKEAEENTSQECARESELYATAQENAKEVRVKLTSQEAMSNELEREKCTLEAKTESRIKIREEQIAEVRRQISQLEEKAISNENVSNLMEEEARSQAKVIESLNEQVGNAKQEFATTLAENEENAQIERAKSEQLVAQQLDTEAKARAAEKQAKKEACRAYVLEDRLAETETCFEDIEAWVAKSTKRESCIEAALGCARYVSKCWENEEMQASGCLKRQRLQESIHAQECESAKSHAVSLLEEINTEMPRLKSELESTTETLQTFEESSKVESVLAQKRENEESKCLEELRLSGQKQREELSTQRNELTELGDRHRHLQAESLALRAASELQAQSFSHKEMQAETQAARAAMSEVVSLTSCLFEEEALAQAAAVQSSRSKDDDTVAMALQSSELQIHIERERANAKELQCESVSEEVAELKSQLKSSRAKFEEAIREAEFTCKEVTGKTAIFHVAEANAEPQAESQRAATAALEVSCSQASKTGFNNGFASARSQRRTCGLARGMWSVGRANSMPASRRPSLQDDVGASAVQNCKPRQSHNERPKMRSDAAPIRPEWSDQFCQPPQQPGGPPQQRGYSHQEYNPLSAAETRLRHQAPGGSHASQAGPPQEFPKLPQRRGQVAFPRQREGVSRPMIQSSLPQPQQVDVRARAAECRPKGVASLSAHGPCARAGDATDEEDDEHAADPSLTQVVYKAREAGQAFVEAERIANFARQRLAEKKAIVEANCGNIESRYSADVMGKHLAKETNQGLYEKIARARVEGGVALERGAAGQVFVVSSARPHARLKEAKSQAMAPLKVAAATAEDADRHLLRAQAEWAKRSGTAARVADNALESAYQQRHQEEISIESAQVRAKQAQQAIARAQQLKAIAYQELLRGVGAAEHPPVVENSQPGNRIVDAASQLIDAASQLKHAAAEGVSSQGACSQRDLETPRAVKKARRDEPSQSQWPSLADGWSTGAGATVEVAVDPSCPLPTFDRGPRGWQQRRSFANLEDNAAPSQSQQSGASASRVHSGVGPQASAWSRGQPGLANPVDPQGRVGRGLTRGEQWSALADHWPVGATPRACVQGACQQAFETPVRRGNGSSRTCQTPGYPGDSVRKRTPGVAFGRSEQAGDAHWRAAAADLFAQARAVYLLESRVEELRKRVEHVKETKLECAEIETLGRESRELSDRWLRLHGEYGGIDPQTVVADLKERNKGWRNRKRQCMTILRGIKEGEDGKRVHDGMGEIGLVPVRQLVARYGIATDEMVGQVPPRDE